MRLLALALALSSFCAVACPDLSGTYATCRSTNGSIGGSTDMVITQRTVNGATIYSVTSTDDETQERKTEEMTADGVTRTETVFDPNLGDVTSSITFSCAGSKVMGGMKASAQGTDLVVINQEIQKSGAGLEMDYAGQIFGMEFTDTIVCE